MKQAKLDRGPPPSKLGEIDGLQGASGKPLRIEDLSLPRKSGFVRPFLHISLSCLLGWCCIADLEVSFNSMSGRCPAKLEATVLT